MKKIVFILICFSAALIVSCGGSGSGESCESNFDCPIGKVCSGGTCVFPDNGSGNGENTELPDEENGQDGNGSGSHDGGSSSPDNDSDSANTDDEITGNCTPGKTQKCGYQGPAGTEDVGPCKASVRTCKEDETWGKCEGEVTPILENNEELCTNGIDDDCDGTVDNGTNNACSVWNGNTEPTEPTEDPGDGTIDVGYTGDYNDAYHVPVDAEICNDSCIPQKADCLPNDIDEGSVDLCNGLDDDCDGKVDEGCPCAPGQTQPCFLGPKNYRNVGTCHDGVQTCKVTVRAATGVWGECVGGISPSLDVCDNADNNCNGCADDKLCCAPPIDCAYNLTADGDFKPFKYKIIDGKNIYDASHKFNDADTATWEWALTKGPCDIVLGTVNSYVKGGKTAAEVGDVDTDNGIQNTVVKGVGLSQFKVKFRLSGNYVLHLKVTRENGEVYECEWVIKVVSNGLRIELCWDLNNDVDADLHLGKGTGTGPTTSWQNNTACYYTNCRGDELQTTWPRDYNWKISGWNYSDTQNYNLDGVWTTLRNPRLDIDNIKDGPIPENINLDNPKDGDVFRVGVNYYSGSGVAHTVVNVYCGGTLKATYGVEPQVTTFNSSKDFWKVVEVQWVGNESSDACVLTPRWNDGSGYVVNQGKSPDYTDW